jgi:hypothetical protein
MSQKSSLPQPTQSVSRVLTADTVRIPDEFCYVRSSRRISAVHQVHRPLVSNLIPDGDGISAF